MEMSRNPENSQELLDYVEIRRCLEGYMSALDRLHHAELIASFTSDADITYHNGRDTYVGGSQWLASAAGRMAKFASTNHTLSNSVIEVRGSTATADSRAVAWLLTTEEDGSIVYMRAVRYLDELVRTPDGWKISKRQHLPVIQFQVPATSIFMPLRQP